VGLHKRHNLEGGIVPGKGKLKGEVGLDAHVDSLNREDETRHEITGKIRRVRSEKSQVKPRGKPQLLSVKRSKQEKDEQTSKETNTFIPSNTRISEGVISNEKRDQGVNQVARQPREKNEKITGDYYRVMASHPEGRGEPKNERERRGGGTARSNRNPLTQVRGTRGRASGFDLTTERKRTQTGGWGVENGG